MALNVKHCWKKVLQLYILLIDNDINFLIIFRCPASNKCAAIEMPPAPEDRAEPDTPDGCCSKLEPGKHYFESKLSCKISFEIRIDE